MTTSRILIALAVVDSCALTEHKEWTRNSKMWR
jgi:hypothetical protein